MNDAVMLWEKEMAALVGQGHLASCNVLDIEFTSGTTLEVYLALDQTQRSQGLSDVASIDLDGMLFCYERPSYVPFSMKNTYIDLDIAWYSAVGALLQQRSAKALSSVPLFSAYPFSYVLEVPAGTLPTGDLIVSHNG
jgi:uncharacterized membrane protein (UPF0127 family)